MSTRCNILLKYNDTKLWLYHHCDGYPEGVGADLKEKLELFCKMRIYDERGVFWFANALLKNPKDRGYELTKGRHGDIEYLYEIDFKSREISTFSVYGTEDF